jgi:2-polyprenyl-6-methoxyphenol hydroxylase-like FAD-dependent oxidoreductase
MTRPRVVVIGAGIAGLAAAAGLHAAGWDVAVCEQAATIEPVGSGLALAPNGLRALDTIGAGDAVRALAVPALLAGVTPGQVLRLDVAELAAPLPSFHRGRVALLGDAAHPMTPNLQPGPHLRLAARTRVIRAG